MNVPAQNSNWNDARVARLKILWAEGAKAGQIAAALSNGGAVITRNAVIGKAHRLCLPMKKNMPSKTARPPMVAA